MSQDNTLLDLDRVPTLDELREFFKKHDWSAAQISDPISRSIEKNETMEAIKKILDSEYEKVAREKGLGSASWYFENEIKIKGEEQQEYIHQGNSMIELRNNTEDLIADAVYEIAENHEDILDIILSQFDMNDPDFEPSDDESSDDDTIIDDYLEDEEKYFEKELTENDCEMYCSLLKKLIKKYHLVESLILRRKKVLRLRNGYAFTYYNQNLENVYLNDPVLIRAKQWIEILKKRFIFTLEHFNDTLLYNVTFNDRFGTPLILHSKYHQNKFRHRIINFLSRCRTKKYNIDRIVSFVTILMSSFDVLKARLLDNGMNNFENDVENKNPNIIIID